ncbi:MAG: cation:proton antiporter [Phycisphaerales bacterium]
MNTLHASSIVPAITLEAAPLHLSIADASAQVAQIADEPRWALGGVMVILAVAFLLSVVRALRGPSLPDRVVALDLMAYFIIGIIGVYAVATNTPSLIMIAIVMGLILFLGTTAFALYLERRARP